MGIGLVFVRSFFCVHQTFKVLVCTKKKSSTKSLSSQWKSQCRKSLLEGVITTVDQTSAFKPELVWPLLNPISGGCINGGPNYQLKVTQPAAIMCNGISIFFPP